jgi:AcrR family transcriptional regulator
MKKPVPDPSPPAERRAAPVRLPLLGAVVRAPERADAARNRERILAAARRLLGRRSIDAICMDEVAHAAGVGKGTLYRRFADRSALCLALLDDSERSLQELVLRGFDRPPGTPAVERLVDLLDALVGFVMENAALLAEAEAFDRGDLSRFDHAVHVWRRRELMRLIRAAHRAGDLPAIDAEFAADLVLAGLEADRMRYHLARAESEAGLRARYLAFFARGLGIPADRLR